MCWLSCSRSIAHLSLQRFHAIFARLRKLDYDWDVLGVHSMKQTKSIQKIQNLRHINGPIGSPESAAATPSYDFLAKSIARHPHSQLAPYPLAKFQRNPIFHTFQHYVLRPRSPKLPIGVRLHVMKGVFST